MLNLFNGRQQIAPTKSAPPLAHDDATREYAYGPAQGLPDTKVGTFTKAGRVAAVAILAVLAGGASGDSGESRNP
jgi:hypothetical protein